MVVWRWKDRGEAVVLELVAHRLGAVLLLECFNNRKADLRLSTNRPSVACSSVKTINGLTADLNHICKWIRRTTTGASTA